METAIVISISALCVSIAGFIWQLYVFFDNAKIKLKVFNHYEIIQGEKSSDDKINIVFTLFNSSTKMALINSIWIEYHLDELSPKRISDVYNKRYLRNISFPLQILPNNIFTFRPHIYWGETEYLRIDTKALESNRLVTRASCNYKECRLIINAINGKEFRSRWIEVDLNENQISNIKDTVIIEPEYKENSYTGL